MSIELVKSISCSRIRTVLLHEKSKIPFSYMLYAYSVKEPIGELNLKRALDEDTGVFSSFFSLLSSSYPLGTCMKCKIQPSLSVFSYMEGAKCVRVFLLCLYHRLGTLDQFLL